MDVTPPEPRRRQDYYQCPWEPRPVGYFLDTETAVIAYREGSGVIWRTNDRGSTWLPSQATVVAGRGLVFEFASPSVGWLLSSLGAMTGGQIAADLYQTRDGGQTWETFVSMYEHPNLNACVKSGIAFADGETGWVTQDCAEWYSDTSGPYLNVTHDGGVTWDALDLPPPAQYPEIFDLELGDGLWCDLSSPFLPSAEFGGFVLYCPAQDMGSVRREESTYMYSTTNGGRTWGTRPIPGARLIRLDDGTYWSIRLEEISGAGSMAHQWSIYASDDGGDSWSFIKKVSWYGEFSFVNADIVFAIASPPLEGGYPNIDESVLVRSTDGGRTWVVIEARSAAPAADAPPTLSDLPPAVAFGTFTPSPVGGTVGPSATVPAAGVWTPTATPSPYLSG